MLIQELRDRKYEAFPKGVNSKKAKSTDEEMDAEYPDAEAEGEAEEKDSGSRDYDYLLSVRIAAPCDTMKWAWSQP